MHENKTLNIALKNEAALETIRLLVEIAKAQPSNNMHENNSLNIALKNEAAPETIRFLVETAKAQPSNNVHDNNSLNIALKNEAAPETIDILLLNGANPSFLHYNNPSKEELIQRVKNLEVVQIEAIAYISAILAQSQRGCEGSESSGMGQLSREITAHISTFAGEPDGRGFTKEQRLKAAEFGSKIIDPDQAPGTRISDAKMYRASFIPQKNDDQQGNNSGAGPAGEGR